jgi:hypothetical protein
LSDNSPASFETVAAEIRRLLALIDRRTTREVRAEGMVEAAAAYIVAHPGARGQAVADAIGRSFEHYRRSIVPKLKARGFTVARGIGGIYPPGRCSAL